MGVGLWQTTNPLKKMDDKIKIVPVFLHYDYGDKSRGDSLEYKGFYLALKQITDEVSPFWYDEYLTKISKN